MPSERSVSYTPATNNMPLLAACLLVIIIFVNKCISAGLSSSARSNPGWTLLLGDGVRNQHSNVHSDVQYPGSRANAASWQDKGHHLWMFGGHGYDDNPTDQAEPLADLWRLDTSNLQWKLIEYSNVPGPSSQSPLRYRPQARSASALCGLTDTMLVLYGGLNNKKHALFDTWIFDIPQSTWIPLFARYANKTKTPPHPKARYDMAFWCLGSKLIVYGGRDSSGKDLDDLWIFSFPGLSWKKQHQYVQMDDIPIGAPDQPFPLARSAPTTWFNDDVLFMYGGSLHNGTTLGDIWSFAINTSMWRFVAEDNALNPRSHGLIWSDVTPGNIVLFGGCSEGNNSILPRHDLAVFNHLDKSWHPIEVNSLFKLTSLNKVSSSFINQPETPTARCQAVTWTRNGQHFLFGGFGTDQMHQLGYLNDLYVLVDSEASLTALFQYKQTVKPKGSLQLSAKRIFLICFASFGGVVLVFGAGFFFKKMVDFPRHHPTRSYNVKYSQLNDEAMFDM